MSLSFLSGKKLKVLLHIVVWAALFVLPTYLLYGDSEHDRDFLREVWFQLACYAFIFYLGYFLLAPVFFFKGRKPAYFLSSAVLVLVLTLSLGIFNNRFSPFNRAENHEPRPAPGMERPLTGNEPFKPPYGEKPPKPFRNWPLFNFLLTSGMVTGLSLGLRLSEKLILNEKMRKEAEKEKLHTELALLKHQINPHFLFNTLNSIYSLALIKSDMTAEAVMKLSDMMRYVIQDVAKETVPLSLELEYLVHYVELQKIRLNEKVDVQLNIEGDPDPYQVAPIILVPFIENAFQYGVSSHENATIRIEVKIADGSLAFRVSNQVFAGREKTGTFGIGIRNTRQRLMLMYPEKHKLEIVSNGKGYMVDLEISLA
jgi:two-component system, LytTR family, sensor kinase